MGAYQGYREGTPDPLLDSFPTPEMRTGDFSRLVDGNGQKITIYDPLTATYDPQGNIVRVFPKVKPAEHSDQVLAALDELQKK